MKTINADGTVSTDSSDTVSTVPKGTVASIINVPPQIAVTIFWVAVGFGLCWWLSKRGPLDRH
jgi:hypothetical protein